jgi:hypothetical protein
LFLEKRANDSRLLALIGSVVAGSCAGVQVGAGLAFYYLYEFVDCRFMARQKISLCIGRAFRILFRNLFF